MIRDIERLIATAPEAAPTRRYEIDHLVDLGINGPAAEMVAGLGAGHRHVARTQIAIRAAAKYMEGIMPSAPHDLGWVAHIWAILTVDGIGIGSTARMPSDGGSTARFPAFAECGKGRKQASDGGAWSAAIADAAQRVAQEAGACFEWDVATISDNAYIKIKVHTGEVVFLAEDLLPSEWNAALAAYHLKEQFFTGLLHKTTCDVGPEEAENIRGWTALYNEAVALMRTAAAATEEEKTEEAAAPAA